MEVDANLRRPREMITIHRSQCGGIPNIATTLSKVSSDPSHRFFAGGSDLPPNTNRTLTPTSRRYETGGMDARGMRQVVVSDRDAADGVDQHEARVRFPKQQATRVRHEAIIGEFNLDCAVELWAAPWYS